MTEDSKKAHPTRVYITGFGPFANIKENPSSSIGKSVATALRARGLLSVVEFVELETSLDAVSEFFTQLNVKLRDALAADSSETFLLLHLGVHSYEKNGVLRAEVRGYNELSAGVPDVRGVLFNHVPIFSADGGIDVYLESWFGREGSLQREWLERVIARRNEELNSRRENEETTAIESPSYQLPRWEISHNAGRYICNCCLYQSLKLQERYPGKVASIFIHVCDPKQGQVKDAPVSASGPEDVKAENASEAKDMPVMRYNPSLVEQSQQVELLVLDLLDMIARSE